MPRRMMGSCMPAGMMGTLRCCLAPLLPWRRAVPLAVPAYFCFQPAEEGGAGAAAMMRDGLFDMFPCRAVFGMHNWPGMAAGQFGIRPGPMFAAADLFEIVITGRGGHAAQPDRAVDPIFAGAAVVQALQSVVSRSSDPLEPAVVTISMFHGGDACNVIPDRAVLGGTVRSFSDTVFEAMYERIERIASRVAGALGASAELKRSPTAYPATVNDAAMASFAGDVIEELGGEIDRDCSPTMGGEDFSFLAQEKPGAFILIGSGRAIPPCTHQSTTSMMRFSRRESRTGSAWSSVPCLRSTEDRRACGPCRARTAHLYSWKTRRCRAAARGSRAPLAAHHRSIPIQAMQGVADE